MHTSLHDKDKPTINCSIKFYVFIREIRNKRWAVFAVVLDNVCYFKRQTNTKLSAHYSIIQTIQLMQIILCMLRRLTNPFNTSGRFTFVKI